MNGEPAMIFIDRMNAANPTPEVGLFETTNPCGEVPLLPFESCNLGSINLGKFVKYNKIDWEHFDEIIKLSVRFLDNVIDANIYPLKEIDEMTKSNRKIGLGVMGWADMLIKLGIDYDSQEARDLGTEVMKRIREIGLGESFRLGAERGGFPNQYRSIYQCFPPLRNATITTVAPTGTISIIADCSSGIEPVFSIITKRNVKNSIGKTLIEINPAVKEILKKRGEWQGVKEALEQISKDGGCINLPKEVRDIVKVANEISAEGHVKMQAAFQKWVDNSISKTVNLPESATVKDIMKIYEMAYNERCKGITVYRNNSRQYQLLQANDGACPTCT
jgi:ribonucleoside-diphosphate reductase alpha chain